MLLKSRLTFMDDEALLISPQAVDDEIIRGRFMVNPHNASPRLPYMITMAILISSAMCNQTQ